MKILIVDDSSTMRKIVMRTLRQAGYDGAEISEAADGVEGLAALDECEVDLIFSDVNMPNMNGLEFVEALRGRDGSAATPVVMVTTESGAGAMDEAKSLGASGYVVKPFTADKLRDVLQDVLG
ncbi:MAG: response regulator [Myxococcota bacterium]|jgi:two-component system chemotaxis response regulator CheY|nr:response regulator [Myxococcota bacterium]